MQELHRQWRFDKTYRLTLFATDIHYDCKLFVCRLHSGLKSDIDNNSPTVAAAAV